MTDREMKDDVLAILPEKLQTDFLWNASDLSMSFAEFRDLVVTHSAWVLAVQRPQRPVRVDSEESTTRQARVAPASGTPQREEALEDEIPEEFVAAFQRLQAKIGKLGGKTCFLAMRNKKSSA